MSQADAVKAIIEEEQTLLNEAKDEFNTLNEEINSSIGNIQTVENITGRLGEIKNTIISVSVIYKAFGTDFC